MGLCGNRFEVMLFVELRSSFVDGIDHHEFSANLTRGSNDDLEGSNE